MLKNLQCQVFDEGFLRDVQRNFDIHFFILFLLHSVVLGKEVFLFIFLFLFISRQLWLIFISCYMKIANFRFPDSKH